MAAAPRWDQRGKKDRTRPGIVLSTYHTFALGAGDPAKNPGPGPNNSFRAVRIYGAAKGLTKVEKGR